MTLFVERDTQPRTVMQHVRVKCLNHPTCLGYVTIGVYCQGCEAAIAAIVRHEAAPVTRAWLGLSQPRQRWRPLAWVAATARRAARSLTC